MATIKSYTDISQSKKLAEILPLESADMYYPWYIEEDGDTIESGHRISIPSVGNFIHKVNILPCWSLAALLDIIPKRIKDYNVLRIDINEKDTAIWYDEIGYGVNNDLPDVTKETAIDTCYEMIIKLHEKNIVMKSYTDLEQSKKLAEILPLESADMYWWSSGKRYYIEAMDDGDFNEEEGHIRAWSLAALLDVLPKCYSLGKKKRKE